MKVGRSGSPVHHGSHFCEMCGVDSIISSISLANKESGIVIDAVTGVLRGKI